ncbi:MULTISPECIES: HlyD family efflux transporter periplasmic adaptor subunit [unclassified Ekhidna]|jgi:HlyD family secretion protein|uniref:HlyD family secretion protein n=1 Tax=unclassified Ekhidna TaxID=2632188 RepID=UPI0032DE7CCD
MKTFVFLIPLAVFLTYCGSPQNASDAYGNFEATEIIISSEVPGKVLSVQVAEGEEIKEGSLIAQIDTMSLYLQKGAILASMNALESKLQNVPVQLKVLQDRLKVLQKEQDRFTQLVNNGAATKKQLDDITGEYQIVKSQLEATKSQLSTANRAILAELEPLGWKLKSLEDQLSRCSIVSPSDGIVISTFKEKGEMVGAGMPLVKIAQLDNMELRVYVSGDQLSKISVGTPADILYDGPDRTILTVPGTVSWVSSHAEFTPKTIQTREERVSQVYAVKLKVANDGSLKIGMPAEVVFDE